MGTDFKESYVFPCSPKNLEMKENNSKMRNACRILVSISREGTVWQTSA
jgi:hypothetical protein